MPAWSSRKRNWRRLIEKLSERELRAFVKKLAGQDGGIRSMLLTRYVVEIDEKQMNRLKQGVDRLVREYSDGNGFIDYRNAWDFTYAMECYLGDKVGCSDRTRLLASGI